MMKRFAAALSAFLLAISCTGCNSGNADSSADMSETTSATTEKATEKEPEAETEAETETSSEKEEDSSSIREIEMNEEFLAKMLTMTDEPSSSAESDVTEKDFIGKWECVAISNNAEEICYSHIFDIPLYATEHLEINEDHTGSILSIKAGETPETSELPFKWELNGNVLNLEVKINDEITTPAAICITDERKLLIQSSDEEGNALNAYYRFADSYTYFDFVTADFDYDKLFEE